MFGNLEYLLFQYVYFFYRGDSKEKRGTSSKSSRRRTRSRSRSNEKSKADDSGLCFDPTNLDKVVIIYSI